MRCWYSCAVLACGLLAACATPTPVAPNPAPASAPVATAPAAAHPAGAAPSPECSARTSELFDYALRYKEAITLGQLERSQAAWAVRRACGDLPGLLSNAVNAARVPPQSAPRTEYDDSWVVPLVFFGAIVHSVTR